MASLPVIRIVMKAVDNVTRQTRQINSSLKSVSATAAQVGATMTAAFSAPVLMAGHNMFATAVENSKAFNLMKANIKEAETSFDELKNASTEFANTSLKNVTEVREGMVELGRAGKDSDEISEMFKPVTNLAIAVDTQVGSSAKTLTNFMNQFQMDVTQTTYAADLMAATVSGSAQNWDDFAASVEHGAAAAKTMGMTAEEFVQMDAMLANFGIQGSRLGAQQKAVMRAMVDPNTFREAFGVETQENGQFRNIIDVYKDVAKVMEDMPEAQRAEKLLSVYGRIGITGSAALSANTEKWEALGATFDNVTGKVDSMAATMGDDLFGAQLMVKNAWGTLTEKLLGREGTMMEVFLRKLADVITKIASLDTKTLDAMAAAALALAAAGPALLLISGITGSLAGLPVLGQVLSGGLTAAASGTAALSAAGGGATVGGIGLRTLVTLKNLAATVSKLLWPLTAVLSLFTYFVSFGAIIKNTLGAVAVWFMEISGLKDQWGRISKDLAVIWAEFKKFRVAMEPLVKILGSLVILPALVLALSLLMVVLKTLSTFLEIATSIISTIAEVFKSIMNFITQGKYGEYMDNQQNHWKGLREFTGTEITQADIAAMNGTREEDNKIGIHVTDDRIYTTANPQVYNQEFGGITNGI